MKRIALLCVALVMAIIPSQAVLKERDLARTLGVLRAELAADYEKQQAFMSRYEQQGAAQHQQLVWYMNQCEQISLMLYSQSSENTFDQAYACQQAVNLYRLLDNRGGRMLPYETMIERMRGEIDRYDALITSLKTMPPVARSDRDELTESETHILNAIDSLENHADTTVVEDGAMPKGMLNNEAMEEEENHEPLYLSGQQLEDRAACLEYAQSLRDNLQTFLERMEAESSYYESVKEKVLQLNDFAQSRYKMLQDNIFRNGGADYITILTGLPRYFSMAERSASKKYAPLAEKEKNYSEWRGVYVLFLCALMLIFFVVSWAVTYLGLRLFMRVKRGDSELRMRRHMLTYVIATALFAVLVMVTRSYFNRNFVQMGTGLIINMAWLMEAIFLSIYIRLKGEQMQHALMNYLPLMLLAAMVILFRIILIPNSILNLIFPPILLAVTLWQQWMVRKHRKGLPIQDLAYSHITTIVMVVSCIASWIGYTLLAVQILVWWTFQLAAIMTITCFYDLMEMFENRYMLVRLRPELKARIRAGEDVSAEAEPVLKAMRKGKFITTTWFYDFINRTLVPILAVGSILVSIYWAAEIFEMTSICQKAFYYDFIHQEDLIQVSLFKVCVVAALWFLFSFLNYSIRSFYVHVRLQTSSDDSLNLTLAKNVIAILCWGLYFIIVLVILKVPKSGISIVTAGLATGLGFAMQDLIENFFYGLSLMTGRLRVGDYIECDGIRGKVENITYQSTQILTGDGCVIAFLNKALFSKNFKNMTRNHDYELTKIPVGVAYGTNVEEVRKLLIDAVTPVCEGKNAAGQDYLDPQHPVTVVFSDFGDSSVDLFVCIWTLVEQKYALSARVKEAIYETLNANHIEIPFPQRDLHIINH